MRNLLVFTLFAVISAVAASSTYNLNRNGPGLGSRRQNWQHHKPRMTRKELLMAAIKHIVEAGRLRERDVMKDVFHSYIPPTRPFPTIRPPIILRPPVIPPSPAVPQPDPIDPGFNKPDEIVVVEPEPVVVVPEPEPSKPIPEPPTVVVPEPGNQVEPEPLPVLPPVVIEPIPEAPEIAVEAPELVDPDVGGEEPMVPVPNPIDEVSSIIKETQEPEEPPTKVLVNMITQLGTSLTKLLSVIDKVVEKGESPPKA